ncbi:MAG: response regulator [Bacteroidota bacterium]
MSSRTMTKSFRFLFIDDSPTDNKYLSLLIRIKKLPIDPHFEYNPQNALNYLATCDKASFPEVIMVDINMPRMNGFQFVEIYLKRFKEHYPETKVYITSSSIQTSDREKVKTHPQIQDFIEKPFNLSQFQQKILPSLI